MNQRTEYVETLSAQMVEWDVQIDRLKELADNATADTKFDYSQTIAALQHKRDLAAEKLRGISAAGDDEWEEMKDGTEQIWGEISNYLRDSIAKLR